jgi:GDP-L-fucose synthase
MISKSSEVTVWGNGKPLREFMHYDDLASALLFLLKNYTGYKHINVGSGDEVSIRELVDVIAEVVGYIATIVWDKSKPDGTPLKLMDTPN